MHILNKCYRRNTNSSTLQIHTHTNTYTHTNTRAHTHTHTDTCTRTYKCKPISSKIRMGLERRQLSTEGKYYSGSSGNLSRWILARESLSLGRRVPLQVIPHLPQPKLKLKPKPSRNQVPRLALSVISYEVRCPLYVLLCLLYQCSHHHGTLPQRTPRISGAKDHRLKP